MRRAEIAAKFDRIVDFAGVGPFIDAPVKFYSSGMYVRLGFAVAAHVDAQILLVDEVLAVGDEVFQQRCYRRIDELRKAGTTIVFISHDLQTVERLCPRAILMGNGQLVADDSAPAVVAKYRRTAGLGVTTVQQSEEAVVKTTAIDFVTAGETGATGHPLLTIVAFEAASDVHGAVVEVSYCTHGGSVLFCQQSTALSGPPLTLERGAGAIEFSTDALGLQPGCYDVTCRIMTRTGATLHTFLRSERLVVDSGQMVGGYFYMPHAWRKQPASEAPQEAVSGKGPIRATFGRGARDARS
jgi:hypothetical protein